MTGKQKNVKTSSRPFDPNSSKISALDKEVRGLTVNGRSVPRVKPETYTTILYFLKYHSALGTLARKDGSVALDNCIYSQELFGQYLDFCDRKGFFATSWPTFCQVTLVVISQISLEDFAISVQIN